MLFIKPGKILAIISTPFSSQPPFRDPVMGVSGHASRSTARRCSVTSFGVSRFTSHHFYCTSSSLLILCHVSSVIHSICVFKKKKKERQKSLKHCIFHFLQVQLGSFFYTSHVSAQRIQSFLWLLEQSLLWKGPCLWILSAVSVWAQFWLMIFLLILSDLILAL